MTREGKTLFNMAYRTKTFQKESKWGITSLSSLVRSVWFGLLHFLKRFTVWFSRCCFFRVFLLSLPGIVYLFFTGPLCFQTTRRQLPVSHFREVTLGTLVQSVKIQLGDHPSEWPYCSDLSCFTADSLVCKHHSFCTWLYLWMDISVVSRLLLLYIKLPWEPIVMIMWARDLGRVRAQRPQGALSFRPSLSEGFIERRGKERKERERETETETERDRETEKCTEKKGKRKMRKK